jgi:hypothetical protein
LVDLVPQHLPQVACFRPEDLLPDGLVSQKGQSVGHELPRAAQFFAYRGNKNRRSRAHGKITYRVERRLTSLIKENGWRFRKPAWKGRCNLPGKKLLFALPRPVW